MTDIDAVLAAIRSTRQVLLPHWGQIEAEYKADGDVFSVVTRLDREVEAHIIQELERIEPGVGFAGEESGGSRAAERFWLCDPIDGTMRYIRGLPHCTVMLALIENGAVTVSAIYDFLNDVMYHAVRGGGAYKNGTRIHVSDRAGADAYIIVESDSRREDRAELWRALRDKMHMVSGSSVAGYEFTLVAEGKIDGRLAIHPNGKDYDFAPGSLLVSEAGGIVTNPGSTNYDFNTVDMIAANPRVYAALTEGPNAIFPIRR